MGGNLRRGDLLYPELSYQIVGILFEVHRELGNRYQEKYYQRAVADGLRQCAIPFREQVPVKLSFKSVLVGRYFVDFLVSDKIILEIKAVSRLTLSDYHQVDGYLKALNKELGIIANFRSHDLTFKRVLNPTIR